MIAQSISSTEPGGGQMIDLARALLNSPGIAEDMEGAFDATSVHPQKGFTGVVLLETGKPMTHVEPTPEEIESVRAGLQHRRGPQESFR